MSDERSTPTTTASPPGSEGYRPPPSARLALRVLDYAEGAVKAWNPQTGQGRFRAAAWSAVAAVALRLTLLTGGKV